MSRLARIREWLYLNRPVITTYRRYDDRCDAAQIHGYVRGIQHVTSQLVGAGYDLPGRPGVARPTAQQHASRITATGKTLVSVGP